MNDHSTKEIKAPRKRMQSDLIRDDLTQVLSEMNKQTKSSEDEHIQEIATEFDEKKKKQKGKKRKKKREISKDPDSPEKADDPDLLVKSKKRKRKEESSKSPDSPEKAQEPALLEKAKRRKNRKDSQKNPDLPQILPTKKKMKWSEKEGLDLRFDKSKVLKQALERKGCLSTEIPPNPQPLIHTGNDNYLGRNKWNTEFDNDFIKQLKEEYENQLKSLSEIKGKKDRRIFFENEIEGTLTDYVAAGGNLIEEEADELVDLAIQTQELPGKHPLQRRKCQGGRARYKHRTGRPKGRHHMSDPGQIYGQPVLRAALQRRGFQLNIGPFSENETLQLMKNFTSFLKNGDFPHDKKSIGEMFLEPGRFYRFYKKTNMLLHVGDKLHKTSYQIYMRLKNVYHPDNCKGTFSAAEDTVILKRGRELKNTGVHRRWRTIADEIDRFHHGVWQRHHTLNGDELKMSKSDMRELISVICDITGCFSSDLDSLKDFPFEEICDRLQMEGKDRVQKLSSFWCKVGMSRYKRAMLPRWTLQDSLDLIRDVEAQKEDDEHCVDFESIFKTNFQGKVENWEHLREHFNRLRRVVPYYLTKNFHAVLSVAKEEILEKFKSKSMKVDEEKQISSDEDDSDDWDEDYFGVTPSSF